MRQAHVTVKNEQESGLGQRAAKIVGYLIAGLLIIWASSALYFDFPIPKWRIGAAVIYLLAILAILWFIRRPLRRMLACLVCFCCVLAWWLTLKPSNQGPWQADVSRTAWAEVYGNRVIIHNFRSCDYRTEFDYTCQWLTPAVDLNRIRGLDLFMDYWASPWIAHTILSFDLEGGDHIAFSIEARKRTGQHYSSIRGFFRQYTLISVVSDERDLVRLRTNFRHGEDLYLFHTKATPAFARQLFMGYIGMTNRLHQRPQWYNAVTHNCTTEIYELSVMRGQPWAWQILLNGKADKWEYERGELAGDLPWKVLKQRAYINPAARAADNDPDFSVRIRENRPGFSGAASSSERRPTRAVSQLLWPNKHREMWFSLEKTTKRPIASVYTNCETTLACATNHRVILSASHLGAKNPCICFLPAQFLRSFTDAIELVTL